MDLILKDVRSISVTDIGYGTGIDVRVEDVEGSVAVFRIDADTAMVAGAKLSFTGARIVTDYRS